MKARLSFLACMLFCCGLIQNGFAYTELAFDNRVENLTPAQGSSANKARIVRLDDGTIIAGWHESVGSPDGAWDLSGSFIAPRDIFIRLSVDGGETWSDKLNISNTAGLTDTNVLYDRVGDGSGLANFFGDSGKATFFANGNSLLVVWNDSYCGVTRGYRARYTGPSGYIELPYRCLYAARIIVLSGTASIVAIDQLTDASRDVTNEVARGTGAGFAIAWQEDPAGLQLGEALGEGDGASGARTTPGTDIWYAWISKSNFADPVKVWQGLVPISNNFDHGLGNATGGGASRPNMALAGSPPTAMIVYEEAKDNAGVDIGKYVIYHQFPFSSPPTSDVGTIVSAPGENSRRARIMAMATPGNVAGARMALMWRQGIGHQGAPADFMMRIGSVPDGVQLSNVPNAGFRVEDLWPTVDPSYTTVYVPALNLSGATVDEPTAFDQFANAKAHRAVMDGDFIYAAYTQDANGIDGVNEYQFFARWSDDGGRTWAAPVQISAGIAGSENVIEPRLMRTPGTIPSGQAQDIRNPDVYVLAWGSEIIAADGSEPIRESLFLTRTVDRGASFERIQNLNFTRTNAAQTDEQIQLRVSPDGQNVDAIWIRRDDQESSVVYLSAVGITPTADLSVVLDATATSVDVGDNFQITLVVANDGPQIAKELQLTATIDAGLSLTGVATTGGTCTVGAVVNCGLDDLAPGAATTVKLLLIAAERGEASVTAEVVAKEDEPNPQDNQSRLLISALPNADLALQMSADIATIKEGGTFRISYEVANDGPQLATEVTFTAFLPSHVEAIQRAGCEQVDIKLTCALANLSAGESQTEVVEIRALHSGSVSIFAKTSSAEHDPVADDNELTIDLTITGDVAVTPSMNATAEGSNGGGCVYAPDGTRDSTLLLVLLVTLCWRFKTWRNMGAISPC